jgi:hypothetical protein
MKIAVMQPYLFPYIGYFQLIKEVDEFVIHDNVQYIKGGWINRNRILLDQNDHLFTFSLKSDSSYKNISERYFVDEFQEQGDTFMRVLQTAYGNAPFFDRTCCLVKDVLDEMKSRERENIAVKISRSIRRISEFLNIDTAFSFASAITQKQETTPEENIIDICEKIGANEYVNLPGGKSLYNFETFAEQNIELYFLEPGLKKYPQFSKKFVSSLSILDVLMFNELSAIDDLLNDYTLLSRKRTKKNV